jgi:hypothetical protein
MDVSTTLPTTQAIPGFDWRVLAVLLVILAASLGVYFELVRRATSARKRETLREWAKQQRFRLVSARDVRLPPPLDQLQDLVAIPMYHLSDGRRSVVMLQTKQTLEDREPRIWHVGIVKLADSAAAAGLRPAGAEASLLDLFHVPVSTVSGESHRFTVLATDTLSARRLLDSHVRGLLPGHLGYLRYGQHIVLDFTARPFDPIELSRVIELLDQLSRT